MARLTWHEVCSQLTTLTEAEITALLDEEMKEHRRPAFVRRLHQRFSTLRAARERAVLMKELEK